VVRESFEITYAAHTSSCTFLLDAEGICRRIVMVPKGKRRDSSRSAARCVGAQYVASLDAGAAGGLVEMPRVGAAMLFARVDERGRISLVRTGVVTSFESRPAHDPFLDSRSVETSAPDLQTVTPRVGTVSDPDRTPVDPDYFDVNDRTQRIPALRPEEIDAALPPDPAAHEMTTAEYMVAPPVDALDVPQRTTMPSPVPPPLPAPATLRRPPRDLPLDDDDAYERAPARGVLPRRSDPCVRAASPARVRAATPLPVPRASEPASTPRTYAPPAPSDVQVVSRRRRG